MRQTAQIMGLIVSLDIPDCDNEEVFQSAFNELRRIDRKFSPFKIDSEVSALQRGEIDELEVSTELKEVIKACRLWEKRTKGYFSAWYSGRFEPSGYVKGWAVKRAGELIKKRGYETFCISAGGDILAASTSIKVWNIGIQDPKNKSKILNKLKIKNGAVATSGTYERGHHIINPKTGKPARGLLSITVIGPDIVTADVLATAGFAIGKTGVKFVHGQKGYQALAIDGKGA